MNIYLGSLPAAVMINVELAQLYWRSILQAVFKGDGEKECPEEGKLARERGFRKHIDMSSRGLKGSLLQSWPTRQLISEGLQYACKDFNLPREVMLSTFRTWIFVGDLNLDGTRGLHTCNYKRISNMQNTPRRSMNENGAWINFNTNPFITMPLCPGKLSTKMSSKLLECN